MKQPFRSRVYTDRPDYADFEPAAKFQAIESIIAKHLRAHPKAICSYSGGADSDIMIDLVERTRALFDLPPVQYVFFDTGLEMKATREHVKATAEKYGVEIMTAKPTEYAIDDVVSEVQNLAAEMATGFIEVRKDKASAQKQDDLYELIRNTAKMIHTDIMTLVQAVRGEGQ